MAIFEGKLGDARVIELANSFATVQPNWTLKCLKIRPMLKIDIGGNAQPRKEFATSASVLAEFRQLRTVSRGGLGPLNFMLAN